MQVWNDARLSWCACVTLGQRCIEDWRWGVIGEEKQENDTATATAAAAAATVASAFTYTAALSLVSPCIPSLPSAQAQSATFDFEFPTGYMHVQCSVP
jgi:hypothetical protein